MKILKNKIGELEITLYVDYHFLKENFNDIPLLIKNIHVVIFRDEGDIYVNNDNYQEIFQNNIKMENIISFFEAEENEFTINKLQFEYQGFDILYDDDALLVIKGYPG